MSATRVAGLALLVLGVATLLIALSFESEPAESTRVAASPDPRVATPSSPPTAGSVPAPRSVRTVESGPAPASAGPRARPSTGDEPPDAIDETGRDRQDDPAPGRELRALAPPPSGAKFSDSIGDGPDATGPAKQPPTGSPDAIVFVVPTPTAGRSPASAAPDRAVPDTGSASTSEPRSEQPTEDRRIRRAPPPADDDSPPPAEPRLQLALVGSALGDALEVVVTASELDDARGVAFHLLYDANVLRFESASEGPLLGRDGDPVVFLARPTANADRIVVGAVRLGETDGVSGTGEVCTIRFAAIGRGDAGIRLAQASVSTSYGSVPAATPASQPYELSP